MIYNPQTALDAVSTASTGLGIAGGSGLGLAAAWAWKVFAKAGELSDLKDRVSDLERHRDTLPDKYITRAQMEALENKIDYLGERADKDTAMLRVDIAQLRQTVDDLKNLLMEKFTR